jgi:CRP/FNR family transcriptional regulator/CRP/FNR family cyclic AMP-dependent transcriptional regulator
VEADLGPGDLFGEMSLLDGERRSATVIADTDMTVTVFNRGEFVRLVEASPVIAMKLLAAMAARLRAVDRALGLTDEQ